MTRPTSAAPATLVSRAIALSHLACVVLFGMLLLRPSQATSPPAAVALILASGTFAFAAIAIARGSHGLVRGTFAAFATVAAILTGATLFTLTASPGHAMPTLFDASSFELTVAMAALNGLLALYGNYALAAERLAAEQLQGRMITQSHLNDTLETRVAERTIALDDAQRVIKRMWWLGQQITLELDPRRVLDRFLEAVADVAQADCAALGLMGDDGNLQIAAASGDLAVFNGSRFPLATSAMGRVIRTGGRWSVADLHEERDQLSAAWLDERMQFVRGAAIVPVHRRGERIGAVIIVSREVRAFTVQELERVEAMSDLLSVALANAELFQTMKQAEWRFRTLFRAAPDAVLTVLLPSGRIREANDAAYDVFGAEPQHLVGKALGDLVEPSYRETLDDALSEALRGSAARVEVQIVTPGGAARTVAVAVSRLPEADPPSVLLIARDVTSERELRARLMEADRLAAVGELVAGVAHEVNNPLSSISAFAQLLLREPTLDPDHRESVEVIRSETMRASQVIKDLLAFARRSEPQRALLDVNSLVERTIRMRQYQFTEARVRLRTEFGASLPPVLGDARQLQQVILNLVTNAVQAMSSAPTRDLLISTSARDGRVCIDITDTGTGIAQGVRARIFEPFFTTKREGEGTGLGLSVSYGIVSAHGGAIDAIETSAQGTTFRVAIPAMTGDQLPDDALDAGRTHVARSVLAGLRVVFVDDEAALRAGMQAFGALRGFTVIAVADGVTALETARSSGADAIVCDLRMPRMNGFDFHAQLRHERPDLARRTIFITGDVITPAMRNGLDQQPVLMKPFSFDAIESALVAVVRDGRAFEELSRESDIT